MTPTRRDWLASTLVLTVLLVGGVARRFRRGGDLPAGAGLRRDRQLWPDGRCLAHCAVRLWFWNGPMTAVPMSASVVRSGAKQQLRRDATGQGAIWISVISSAPGEQGYADAQRANRLTQSRAAWRRRMCCWIRRGRLGNSTARRPRRICSSSHRRARWPTWGVPIALPRRVSRSGAGGALCAGGDLYGAGEQAGAASAVTRPCGCTVKYAA